ncbi:MAG: LacI family DNA-binding transcriptional regulator [Bacteroidetes bacterium]|nr:LacI family DNA-binding transcriptional regulator [Bacteroidota bacterium]
MNSTIHDVARIANVSISTVSRVLNDSAPVSDPKRTRVLDAISTLNFTPNPIAQCLIGHPTGTIGAILPHISGEFFADLLSGLDAAVKHHHYTLMVTASRRVESDFMVALKAMHKRVDGLIVMSPELTSDHVRSLISTDIPVVFLNTETSPKDTPSVNFDNSGGMKMIGEHLVELGHSRIAYISGPKGAYDALQRWRGFNESIPNHVTVSYYQGDFTFKSGYDIASQILTSSARPSAIAASNDLSALGAMRALLEHGVRIPDDIAVTGFDGTASAYFSTPSLTTVNIPIGHLSANAVNILIKRLSKCGIHESTQVNTPIDLIIRESTQSFHSCTQTSSSQETPAMIGQS